jgi:hypothetical protein
MLSKRESDRSRLRLARSSSTADIAGRLIRMIASGRFGKSILAMKIMASSAHMQRWTRGHPPIGRDAAKNGDCSWEQSERAEAMCWGQCRKITSAKANRKKSHAAATRVEYSVVQLTDDTGWRWEVRFADGKRKSGVTRGSRESAINIAEYEIDRTLKDHK